MPWGRRADILDGGGTLAEAVDAARKGRDGTLDLQAQRGRAQYVENKGQGHVDPGAVSIVILLETLEQAVGTGS